jgi:hypothetical protein
MRKKLAEVDGERKVFRATFSRMGKKINYHGYREDTLLLTHVVDAVTNKVVADHIWFTYSKAFEKLVLKEGDQLEFEARVREYRKGYVNRQLKVNQSKNDYKLSYPTKIKVVQ